MSLQKVNILVEGRERGEVGCGLEWGKFIHFRYINKSGEE
jgi:hypothetical protein